MMNYMHVQIACFWTELLTACMIMHIHDIMACLNVNNWSVWNWFILIFISQISFDDGHYTSPCCYYLYLVVESGLVSIGVMMIYGCEYYS